MPLGMFKKWLAALGILSASTALAETMQKAIEAQLVVGKAIVVECPSPTGGLGAVFEDDGETGYFYALDFAAGDNPIQEAMSIYDVAQVVDRQKPSSLVIRWSKDGRRVGLWINGHPHAVFDFVAKRGYSRTNFPAPGKWKGHDFAWDDAALDFFR